MNQATTTLTCSEVDDAYLGGERSGGKAGRGSESTVPFIAAVSLSDDGHPLRTPVSGFSLNAIGQGPGHIWPLSAPCSPIGWPASVQSPPGCTHQPTAVGGRKPEDLPEFPWINAELGNLKTSLNGSYHAFDFRKYAAVTWPRSVAINV
ncbi:ISXO2-like transposase domain protein [Azoarcus sp. Aa7]|nr:ISXO2-like transposase domain protein [Azoarcus sp. Aa7]